MKKKILVSVMLFLFLSVVCLSTASLMYLNQNQVVVHQLPLQQRWSFEAKDQIKTTPVVHDDKIFFASGTELFCVEASTGNLVWSISVPSSITSNPVVHSETIVVSYSEGLGAFDTKNGGQLWHYKLHSSYPYYPAIANDKYVVFLSYSAMVHDIKTGKFLWRVGEPYPAPLAFAAKQREENLYVVFEDQISNYDLDTKQTLWEDFTEEWSSYEGLLTNNVFYLKRDEAGVAAYDLKKRKLLWSRDDPKLSRYPISKQDEMLILGGRGGVPVAIDAETGETIWIADELNGLDNYQTPLVIDDTIYIRGLFMKRIYALDKNTGKLVGYINLGVPDIVSGNAARSLGPVRYRELIVFPIGKQLLAFEKQ